MPTRRPSFTGPTSSAFLVHSPSPLPPLPLLPDPSQSVVPSLRTVKKSTNPFKSLLKRWASKDDLGFDFECIGIELESEDDAQVVSSSRCRTSVDGVMKFSVSHYRF